LSEFPGNIPIALEKLRSAVVNLYSEAPPKVSSNVFRLRCWFRITLTVNRFELRNPNLSTIHIFLCILAVLQKLYIPHKGIKILSYEDIY